MENEYGTLLQSMRETAKIRHIPIISDEAFEFLSQIILERAPERVLEIGTATGYSALKMLQILPKSAHITTLELDPVRFAEAEKNFSEAGATGRVSQVLVDAKQYIKAAEKNHYQLIFLDGPKGQYCAYLDDLIRLLKDGGIIFADNIFYHGLVKAAFLPHKHRTIAVNLRKFIEKATSHPMLKTKISDSADGIAIMLKI